MGQATPPQERTNAIRYQIRRIVERVAVRRVLAQMPEDMTEVLILREMEGQTYDDIAARPGLPLGTVKSRLSAARAVPPRSSSGDAGGCLMHCFQVRRLLDEYRDGELRGSQRSAWETHLRSCARCSALLRGREDVSALPRRWEDARSSDELTARVVIAWQAPWPQECQRVHRRSVAARAAVGAAALVSVAVFAGVRVVAAAREVSAPPAGADRIHGPFGRASGPDAWDAGRRELGG